MREARRAEVHAGWGEEYVERVHAKGKLTTWERLEILKVREIIGYISVTAVPQTPAHVKGVINLRGQVIPVSDLRLRFGMDMIAYNDRTCIIVVDIRGADSTTRMGVIVDAVSEVLNVRKEEIEASPSFGALARTEYILGMANMDESVKILLDIDRVFDPEDIAMLEKAA